MRCQACGSYRTCTILDLGPMPLSVLSLPTTPDESLRAAGHSVRINVCADCTHVFNAAYSPDFDQCPEGGCTMYNAGAEWREHMGRVARLVEEEADGKVVEIGAGNGEFAGMVNVPQYVAYEPAEGSTCHEVVTTRQAYFNGGDVYKEKPSLLVMRHVLEHFAEPGDYLSLLRGPCLKTGTKILIEVPCVENALKEGRLEDWVYEHPQHFTCISLSTLLHKTGWHLTKLFSLYGEEVIVMVAEPCEFYAPSHLAHTMANFEDLKELLFDSGMGIVFWGGAGKGAAMIKLLDLPTKQVTVVDSDERKIGKYVPGTRHIIHCPRVLKHAHPDMVIITTSWRAGDIVADMKRRDISTDNVYIMKQGTLHRYEV